ALDVHLIGKVVANGGLPLVHCSRSRPRWVFFVKVLGQLLANLPAVGGVLLGDFIADAPDNHTRMVAIAPGKVAQVALRPFVKIFAIAVWDFRDAPHVKGFVHDNNAHPVGEFEQFGSRRIVARSNRVYSRAFQDFDFTLDGAAIDRRSQRAKVVMQAYAMNLVRLAVQQKSMIAVEGDSADSEPSCVFVDYTVTVKHLGD